MSNPVARDLKNDAEWLRTIADNADILPDGDAGCATVTIDSANQWLWPETRDNLRDIATAIEALSATPRQVTEAMVEAFLRSVFNDSDDDSFLVDGSFDHRRATKRGLLAALATPSPTIAESER